ncbi:hypothetical protein EV385_3918 [Krasilnikovia cinnamomea]|uniref:Uncharacterized protein n=1 Tax=Krasilnikovia cinnamomea TaxID=349313 RepID=A0A4Q7ZM74_9ACTN|nr:hypothetical protein [Krasilnikovia cinnamomea]RZU52077.1 hypothetical protein EV385_3918 [Krasilnikovia cinnamomea]
MRLAEILDVIEVVLNASEHPDIVQVDRYGDATEPWGPNIQTSKSRSISGVRVRFQSSASAMIFGAIWPGETPVPVPDEMPPPARRAPRLAIFVVQLLDVARPTKFRSWQLVALSDLGPTDARGSSPSGVSLVCADGTKMLLRVTGASASIGVDPETEPFPDYVMPDAVKLWHRGRA